MLNFDLLNNLISWRLKKRFHQIELFMKYPDEVQSEWLFRLLRSAAQTEYGKKYDFASIHTYEQFRERIPLVSYEDIHGYVERLRRGEQNILWPSEVKWFAKSSGTTSSRSKFIPISRESIEECHFKGGKDLLSLYCNAVPETRIFTGKGLRLGGSTSINSGSNDSFYGDLSAIIIENLPFWVTVISTPSNKISLMEEWESKIEKIARTTIEEDVTSMAGVPSWMLVLAKRVLEISGANHLKEVWPNLELYLHGGVSFEPYRQQFESIIPQDNFHFFQTFNASEGFFGIQDRAGADDMLLMLDYGIFYEFIPMHGSVEGGAIPLDEVEEGVQYAMVITTNGGLWRYQLGDTIIFTSIHPFRIRVTGRTKHFINAFGEELIIENADTALKKACEKTGAAINDYTAGPIFMSDKRQGGHEWIIEFGKEPVSIQEFSEILDEELKKLNTDYEAKRHKDMALAFPRVHSAPHETFHKWLKTKDKLGGQNKVPRLANNRDYLDELLPILKQTNG
jgi:hypothetical protein